VPDLTRSEHRPPGALRRLRLLPAGPGRVRAPGPRGDPVATAQPGRGGHRDRVVRHLPVAPGLGHDVPALDRGRAVHRSVLGGFRHRARPGRGRGFGQLSPVRAPDPEAQEPPGLVRPDLGPGVTRAGGAAVSAPEDRAPEKLGDIAADAGLSRIQIVAWRDLDDPEAGGSEVHAARVAALWAQAGIDVVMRTSAVPNAPAVVERDGYRVVRRLGRYSVFPGVALSELARRTGRGEGLVEVWNG